jgi:tetratricopeptide (TPR) repeat protein
VLRETTSRGLLISFGNRTQNSRVAGARPNHQPIGGSDPNHQGINAAGTDFQKKKCSQNARKKCSKKSVRIIFKRYDFVTSFSEPFGFRTKKMSLESKQTSHSLKSLSSQNDSQTVTTRLGFPARLPRPLVTARPDIAGMDTGAAAPSEDEDGVCFICLKTSPWLFPPQSISLFPSLSPIQSGCACRGDAGLAHLGCRFWAAEELVERKGSVEWWWTCQTCKQHFTGEMRVGLAAAWCYKVRDLAEDDGERLSAVGNLAAALSRQGRNTEAEEMQREVLAGRKRVLGAEHARTMIAANNLALTLSNQGKNAEAEEMHREVLAVRKRVLGAEHHNTLTTAGNLACILANQGNYEEAEKIQREVLAGQKLVLGAENPVTLTSAGNLATFHLEQEKYQEAEEMLREVLVVQKRVCGEEHPETLTTANNLALSLLGQGKHAEAEARQSEVLAVSKRVLGAEHPDTRRAADNLAHCLSRAKVLEGGAGGRGEGGEAGVAGEKKAQERQEEEERIN